MRLSINHPSAPIIALLLIGLWALHYMPPAQLPVAILPAVVTSMVTMLTALAISTLLASTFVSLQYQYPESILIQTVYQLLVLLAAIPSGLSALLLYQMIVYYQHIDWLPMTHIQHWQDIWQYSWQLRIPICIITVQRTGRLISYMEALCQQISQQLFISAARAKGLSRKQVYRQHIRPHIWAIYKSAVPQIGCDMIFRQSVMIEYIFSIPGIGLLGYMAVIHHDHTTFLHIIICYCVAIISTSWWRYNLSSPRSNILFPVSAMPTGRPLQ